MGRAARTGDPTSHPGTVSGPGAVNVLVEGKPAANVGAMHACAMPPNGGPHPPTPISKGSATVLIAGTPAARVGDMAACGASIISGAGTVEIGG